MGLFEQFPYTNFHELNLDWLIEQLKLIKESTVLSVNGETGDVILYKDPLVRLPDITQDTWNLFRYADGTPVGIQFKKGSPLQRIDNLGRYDIYDANNPPPYPVTAVNGQTGDVVISIPVQSVNGMTGNVILYQQANVELPALESGDTWSIWRETESNAEVGLRFTSGQPIKRMDDGDEFSVYDTGNPPPYPVTSVAGLQGAVAFLNTQIVTDQGTQKVKILFPVESVDGLTGTVRTWANTASETLKTPAASEGDRWSLARECPSGDVGIRFTYDSNNGVQGFLVFSDGQNPETTLRILTPADIPSSSGVVSINGLSGVVVLYAADLQMSSGDNTTIPQAINNKAPIESLAIPIVGNVASVNVPAGSFVYVKNSTITGISDGLYIAVNAISANTAFTVADLDNTNTAVGGLNALNSKITWKYGGATNGTTLLVLPNGNWKELALSFWLYANPKIAMNLYISNNPNAERHYSVQGYLSQTEITAASLSESPGPIWVDVYVYNENIILLEADSAHGASNYRTEAHYRD